MSPIVRGSFRKQLSDGNYGSEVAEVVLEVSVDEADGETSDECAMALLAEARQLVHEELGRSPSRAIREAIQPRTALKPSAASVPPDEDEF